MDILCTFLNHRPDLSKWIARPINPAIARGPGPRDHRDNHERVIGVETSGPPQPGGLHSRAATLILSYQVFPPSLLSGVLERTPVDVGDTVGAAYHFLPGIDIFFASRVVERFDREENGLWRTGFTHQTLVEHPELGQETFVVEKNLQSGEITVALRAWSRTGLWLTKLGAPVVRRLQVNAGQAALDYLGQAAKHGTV